jgi:ABC-type nitrate/sulfonate/bicarbonate transport system ATPase subunit
MEQRRGEPSQRSEQITGAYGRFADIHQEFPRPGQEPLAAIESISFELHAGTLATLLGPSGCGKTTFLRIAAGLVRATSGIVQINGKDVTEPQPDFGIAFQQSNLMPWRSVLRNVLFPMEIRHETAERRWSARRSCSRLWVSGALKARIRRSYRAGCNSGSHSVAR